MSDQSSDNSLKGNISNSKKDVTPLLEGPTLLAFRNLNLSSSSSTDLEINKINDFFKSSFTRICKSTKHLLVSCLSRCESDDEKLNLMVYLCNSPYFVDLVADPSISTVLAITLASDSIIKKENFQYINSIENDT